MGDSQSSNKAYQNLKEKIISLELQPGQKINLEQLGDELNFGRTPLREALNQLNHDGLVKILPRQGTFVTNIKITDLQHICEVRFLLESHCAKLASQRINSEQLETLESLISDSKYAVEEADHETLLQLDEDFHETITEATNNQYFLKYLKNIYDHSLRLWYLSFSQAGQLRETVQEHKQIFNALSEHDQAKAEQAAQNHINQFRKKVKEVV